MRHHGAARRWSRLFGLIVATGLPAWAPAPAQAAPFAYVSNFLAGTVSVIDTATNDVVAVVPVGTRPGAVAVHPSGTFVYVTHFFSNTVSVLDTATNSVVASVPVGNSPGDLAVHPSGTILYVTHYFSDTVSVLDTVSKTVVATIPVPAPVGVAVHPAGTFVYVVDEGPNTLSVVDTITNAVTATVRFPGSLDTTPGVAVHPAGTFVYVPLTLYDALSVVDTATNSVVATVPVGTRPLGVAVHPAGRFVYVVNTFTFGRISNDVSVIDTATNTVVATIPKAGSVAVHPAGTFLYVSGGGDVLVIDTRTNAVAATVAVGDAGAVAIGPRLPGLSLTLNEANFQPGKLLTLVATTYPGERPRLVDAYLEVQLPDGTVRFVQADGTFTTDRQPIVSHWTVRPFSGEIFRYPLRGGEPSGSYTWRSYFTEPGTSTVVGLIAQAPFTVGPRASGAAGVIRPLHHDEEVPR